MIWRKIESSQQSCEIQVFMEGARYAVGGESENQKGIINSCICVILLGIEQKVLRNNSEIWEGRRGNY